jgi:hypothetical protein
MTQIETLASVQGRSLLRDIFRELRYERRVGAVQALTTLWRICTTEQELIRLTKRDVVILHPLGVVGGTTIWMQEIVNRFFYSPINAFVYAGAALLLVIVGLNRTGVMDQTWIIVSGVILEAVLLLVLFVVMYFTPPDEADIDDVRQGSQGASDELLRELGEIGRDYAAMAVQLEAISASLVDLVEKQDTMTSQVRESVNAAISAVAPNPELMASLKNTTDSLDRFANSVDALSSRLQAVERQEVERLVRSELEKILSRQILSSDERSTSTTPTD